MTRRGDIDRLQREIHELMADLWQLPRPSGARRVFRPRVDCFRADDDPPALHVVVELAGVDPAAVSVLAADQALVVSGERRRPRVDCPGCYQQLEIDFGPFECRVPLAEAVDLDAAAASYEDGFLRIVLPLAATPKPPAPRAVTILVKVGR